VYQNGVWAKGDFGTLFSVPILQNWYTFGVLKKGCFCNFFGQNEEMEFGRILLFFAMLCMANKGGVADHNSVLTGLISGPLLCFSG
jgi:hypothetical protein